MIYLLDTNILIYLIKKKPPQVADRIGALPAADQLAMSFVTWAELLQGAAGSTKRVVLEQQLERLVLQVPVLFPQGPEICQHYAEQATALKRAGTPIGANDLWIACHALAEGATVVTNNQREFQRIAGLPLANWVEP